MKKISNKHSKSKAHYLVTKAVSKGELIKLPCEKCESLKSIAHHTDYSKPLDVMWLCRKHHSEWHSENGFFENIEGECSKHLRISDTTHKKFKIMAVKRDVTITQLLDLIADQHD